MKQKIVFTGRYVHRVSKFGVEYLALKTSVNNVEAEPVIIKVKANIDNIMNNYQITSLKNKEVPNPITLKGILGLLEPKAKSAQLLEYAEEI